VRNRLRGSTESVRNYFDPTLELIEHYPWEVSLSFMFAKIERAHVMSLYCGVVKMHKVDATLAQTAVDRFENDRKTFRTLFEAVFDRKLPHELIQKIEIAQKVRNRVLHGKPVEGAAYRRAVMAIIEYAEGFNDICTEAGGFTPFGRLQGYKGRGVSLDKSTSRWVLKGIELPVK